MPGALHSAHRDPGASPGLMLWRVTNAWQRTVRAALAPLRSDPRPPVLLAVLTAMDPSVAVTQRGLARQAATDPTMTSQVLRALEGKGLVERLHPTDGRARTLAATPAGIELANRANVAVEAADDDYFAALGDDAAAFTHSLALLART
ncbi:MAG: MarR family transcriptional regulator [Micropruina sp.]